MINIPTWLKLQCVRALHTAPRHHHRFHASTWPLDMHIVFLWRAYDVHISTWQDHHWLAFWMMLLRKSFFFPPFLLVRFYLKFIMGNNARTSSSCMSDQLYRQELGECNLKDWMLSAHYRNMFICFVLFLVVVVVFSFFVHLTNNVRLIFVSFRSSKHCCKFH